MMSSSGGSSYVRCRAGCPKCGRPDGQFHHPICPLAMCDYCGRKGHTRYRMENLPQRGWARRNNCCRERADIAVRSKCYRDGATYIPNWCQGCKGYGHRFYFFDDSGRKIYECPKFKDQALREQEEQEEVKRRWAEFMREEKAMKQKKAATTGRAVIDAEDEEHEEYDEDEEYEEYDDYEDYEEEEGEEEAKGPPPQNKKDEATETVGIVDVEKETMAKVPASAVEKCTLEFRQKRDELARAYAKKLLALAIEMTPATAVDFSAETIAEAEKEMIKEQADVVNVKEEEAKVEFVVEGIFEG